MSRARESSVVGRGVTCVETVVGYHIPRSSDVSSHVVSQKHSGSVFYTRSKEGGG